MTENETKQRIDICCDMRGMLSFTILWLLTKEDMYGQQIAEELRKRRGSKPNPGTIYPALKDLQNRELIVSRKAGVRTIYRLTEKGKIGAVEACRYFCRAYGDIFKEYQC
jgi:DNA-binding PadR family transcriptional regulator